MRPNEHQEKTAQFLKMYDEYADAIFRFCYFRTGEREAGKELAQATFVRVWEYLYKGKRIENPKGFLYRVARNLVIDRSREKKTVSLDMLALEGFDAGSRDHEKIEVGAEVAMVLKSAGSLEEKHREAFLFRYVDGLSPGDIAGITGETENAVSVRIHRAVEKIKQIYHERKNHGK